MYITVLRKLRPLGYLCSYSHGGKFYTLEKLAQFDEHGLFRVGHACFSRFGSLLDTTAHWVNEAAAGYYVAELNRKLAVSTKDALRLLARHRRVVREEIAGEARLPATGESQEDCRQQSPAAQHPIRVHRCPTAPL